MTVIEGITKMKVFFYRGVYTAEGYCNKKGSVFLDYIVSINEKQNEVLRKMVHDRSYWASGIPPSSVNELLKWSLEDYVDNYQSYLLNKKGEN